MTVDELKSNLDKRHIIYKNEQYLMEIEVIAYRREYLIRDLENTLLSEAKGIYNPVKKRLLWPVLYRLGLSLLRLSQETHHRHRSLRSSV